MANVRADAVDTAKVKSEPSSTVKQTSKRREPIEAGKHSITHSMPTVGPDGAAPVRYNGGVIYTSPKKCAFRVLTTRGDTYTEKVATWGNTETYTASWAIAVNTIDDARELDMTCMVSHIHR